LNDQLNNFSIRSPTLWRSALEEENMNNKLMSAAIAALILPTAAMADVKFAGSAYVGYGNVGAGGKEGGVGTLNLSVEGREELGSGIDLIFKGDLYGRTNQDDLPLRGDEVYDVELGLDFGAAGVLKYTTYGRCDAKRPNSWVDGDLGNGGSVAVHPRVAPKFRCVGGNAPLFNAGPLVVDSNGYFAYEYHRGPFALDLYYDPDLSYGDWSGDDAHTLNNMTIPGDGDLPAQAEVLVHYAFPKAILFAGTNDLGDWLTRAVVPMPTSNLTVIYEHQYKNVGSNQNSDILVFDWKPKDMGTFQGLTAIIVRDEEDQNAVFSANFGTDQWSFGLGADMDGDFALEGSVKLTDTIDFLFGADTGFDQDEGFDFAGFPPPHAPARDAAFEVGLKMTF
jgi:hypothetical protein